MKSRLFCSAVLVSVLAVACGDDSDPSGGGGAGGGGGDSGGAPPTGAGGEGGEGGQPSQVAEVQIQADGFCVPSCFELHVGQERQLTALVLDAAGEPLTGIPVTWSTSDDAVLTIDENGLTTGVGVGEVEVTATADGVEGSAAMNVLGPQVITIEITPPLAELEEIGDTVTFTAVAKDENGEVIPDAPISWITGNPDVATIDGAGELTGIAQGHTIVLAGSGFAEGWAEAIVVSPIPTGTPWVVSSFTAGGNHGCAVHGEGDLSCWGYNFFGQLGNGQAGQEAFEPTAVPVTGTQTWASASAGLYHTCALTTDGKAYCWGQGAEGELGNGNDQVLGSPTPLEVVGGHTFKKLAAGGSHTCGITTADALYCWGGNLGGALGDGTMVKSFTPKLIAAGTTFRDIATSLWATCGITMENEALCWGTNEQGELGNGSALGAIQTTPGAVSTDVELTSIDAYGAHYCAVSTDGDLWCWGRNDTGQLGNGETMHGLEPVQVDSTLSFTKAVGGGHHSCALDDAGKAYCWGHGGYGQVGSGPLVDALAPEEVAGDLVFVDLAAGSHYTCGRTAAGAAYCWGSAALGDLGAGFGGGGRLSAVPVPMKTP